MKDMNIKDEEVLDKELGLLLESMPEQENFEKKIDKYIKKKIQKITVRTVLSLLLVIAVLFLLISPVMNAIYFNPEKLQKDGTLLSVFRDYCEVSRPQKEVISIDVKSKGFSRYKMSMGVHDHTAPLIVGRENVWVDVFAGKYQDWQDSEMMLTPQLGMFDHPVTQEEIDSMIGDFKKLPESAKISLAIWDKEVRDVEELRKENVSLDWIEVYHPNQPEFQGGLNLWMNQIVKETDDREEMTEKELLDLYVAKLKNLVEHGEVWRSMGFPYHSTVFADGEEQMKACYEDAKTLTKLQTKGYYISGSRDEIISYLQKTGIESVSVYDVNSSIWE